MAVGLHLGGPNRTAGANHARTAIELLIEGMEDLAEEFTRQDVYALVGRGTS